MGSLKILLRLPIARQALNCSVFLENRIFASWRQTDV